MNEMHEIAGEARAAEKNVLLTGYRCLISPILFGRESSFPKARGGRETKKKPPKDVMDVENKRTKEQKKRSVALPKFFFLEGKN